MEIAFDWKVAPIVSLRDQNKIKSVTLEDAFSTTFLDTFRSISLRSAVRRPCRFRNSELRNLDNGLDSVKSKMDGPNARPT